MRSTRVKFCGLTRPEDVETAIALGAGFLGFIVECESPRRLSVQDAARLSLPAVGLAKRVAVTVNPDNALIDQITGDMKPDFIQLHGGETPQRLNEIKSRTEARLIKALSIGSIADLELAKSYENIVDYLLLDAKPPKDTAQRGGHGISFNWRLLRDFDSKVPIILAGGLSAKNIAAAQLQTNLNIFDVSSGVEAAPGIKDASLMAEFMKAVRDE